MPSVFSNVFTKMITVVALCYKGKPLKNGELAIKVKVCKGRKTRYLSLGVSTNPKIGTSTRIISRILTPKR